jgi:hypothetical protein
VTRRGTSGRSVPIEGTRADLSLAMRWALGSGLSAAHVRWPYPRIMPTAWTGAAT